MYVVHAVNLYMIMALYSEVVEELKTLWHSYLKFSLSSSGFAITILGSKQIYNNQNDSITTTMRKSTKITSSCNGLGANKWSDKSIWIMSYYCTFWYQVQIHLSFLFYVIQLRNIYYRFRNTFHMLIQHFLNPVPMPEN